MKVYTPIYWSIWTPAVSEAETKRGRDIDMLAGSDSDAWAQLSSQALQRLALHASLYLEP